MVQWHAQSLRDLKISFIWSQLGEFHLHTFSVEFLTIRGEQRGMETFRKDFWTSGKRWQVSHDASRITHSSPRHRTTSNSSKIIKPPSHTSAWQPQIFAVGFWRNVNISGSWCSMEILRLRRSMEPKTSKEFWKNRKWTNWNSYLKPCSKFWSQTSTEIATLNCGNFPKLKHLKIFDIGEKEELGMTLKDLSTFLSNIPSDKVFKFYIIHGINRRSVPPEQAEQTFSSAQQDFLNDSSQLRRASEMFIHLAFQGAVRYRNRVPTAVPPLQNGFKFQQIWVEDEEDQDRD